MKGLPPLGTALALALVALCATSACRDQAGRAPSPSEEPGVPVLGSLPPFSLTDQAGAAFGRSQLGDRVWVADFIFTRCPDVCPMLTAEMARLQRDLLDSDLDGVRLLSISVDPEHDSPEVLAAYADRHRARPGRWSFLTGPRPAVTALTRDGFRLPVGEASGHAGGPILHSDRFVIVDAQARIRGYYSGLDPDDQAALRRDLRIVAGEPGPAVTPEVRPPDDSGGLPPPSDAEAPAGRADPEAQRRSEGSSSSPPIG